MKMSKNSMEPKKFNKSNYKLRSITQVNHPAKIQLKSKKITDYLNVRKRYGRSSSESSLSSSKRKLTQVENTMDSFNLAKQNECLKNIDDVNDNEFEKVITETPSGRFSVFSQEMFMSFCYYVPPNRLGNLCLLSKCVAEKTRAFVLSAAGRRKFRTETLLEISNEEKYTVKDVFYCWGAFVKSATINFTLTDRLNFLERFYCLNKVVIDRNGWGRLLFSFCRNWDSNDCNNLLYAVINFNDHYIENMLFKILNANEGRFSDEEIMVRQYLRSYFLDHKFENNYLRCFWLTAVLRTQLMPRQQSRLLFILYGPTVVDAEQERIDWYFLSRMALVNYEMNREKIEPISHALSVLVECRNYPGTIYGWTDQAVFNMIEQITTSPDHWMLDNFVALFIHRQSLVPIAFILRLAQGHSEEAGQLFVAMKSLLYRWGMDATETLRDPLIKVFNSVPPQCRRNLMGAIYMTQASQLKEYLDNQPFVPADFLNELASIQSISSLIYFLSISV